MTALDTHRLPVAAVERPCPDAVAVTLAVPDRLRDVFSFRAGQFVTVNRPGELSVRRTYSIAAAVGEPLRLGVREIPGGALSPWLVRDLRPGDVLEVAAPSGRWQAEPAAGERHLCVAAGSGITPVLSVAATVLTDPRARVTLLRVDRTAASAMFVEQVADLKNRYGPRLQLVHVLTREPRGLDLLDGRLDAARLARLLEVLAPAALFDRAWLCGPASLVREGRTLLRSLGVPHVHTELFHAAADTPGAQLPAGATEGAPGVGGPGEGTGDVRLTVVLHGRAGVTRLDRATPLLDAARTVRGDVPFACRGGVCGTCRALVREGEVVHGVDHALDEDERAAGFVLTCQARAASAQVTLDYDG